MPDITNSKFPMIMFDKIPAGMEKSKGRNQRNDYDWGSFPVKAGIVVPGASYKGAAVSATVFAKKFPHDDEQVKKIKAHITRKITAAKKELAEGVEWTEAMEKNIVADPEFLEQNSRYFATQAVRDPDTNKIIKDANGDAVNYHIVRTR